MHKVIRSWRISHSCSFERASFPPGNPLPLADYCTSRAARLTRELLELHRRLFSEPRLLLLLRSDAALVDAHDLGRGLFDAVPVEALLVDCGLTLLLRLVNQLPDVVRDVGHVGVCALRLKNKMNTYLGLQISENVL